MNKGAACPKFGVESRHLPARFLFSTRISARNCSPAQIPSMLQEHVALGIQLGHTQSRDSPRDLRAAVTRHQTALMSPGSLWHRTWRDLPPRRQLFISKQKNRTNWETLFLFSNNTAYSSNLFLDLCHVYKNIYSQRNFIPLCNVNLLEHSLISHPDLLLPMLCL